MSNWGRGTGNACEWEALTQGTQGEKTEICCFMPVVSFSLVLVSGVQSCAPLFKFIIKFRWGQLTAWLDFAEKSCLTRDGGEVHGDDQLCAARPRIFTHALTHTHAHIHTQAHTVWPGKGGRCMGTTSYVLHVHAFTLMRWHTHAHIHTQAHTVHLQGLYLFDISPALEGSQQSPDADEGELYAEIVCGGPLGSLGQKHGHGSSKRKISSSGCVLSSCLLEGGKGMFTLCMFVCKPGAWVATSEDQQQRSRVQ